MLRFMGADGVIRDTLGREIKSTDAPGQARVREDERDAEIAALRTRIAELEGRLTANPAVRATTASEPAPKKDRAAYMREYQRKRREMLKAIPKP